MLDVVEVTSMGVVLDEGRKLELAIGMRIGCRRHLPNFELPTKANGEPTAGGGEGERGGGRLEREMVDTNSSCYIGQYGLAIFVDGQKEVSLGRESYPRNVLSMCEGEGVGLVAEACVSKAGVPSTSVNMYGGGPLDDILNKVEDGDPVSYRRV